MEAILSIPHVLEVPTTGAVFHLNCCVARVFDRKDQIEPCEPCEEKKNSPDLSLIQTVGRFVSAIVTE